MSEIVEELLHKHGLLNRPRKPRTIGGESLARYRWRLLRNCIRDAAEQMITQDKRDLVVSHGIQFLRKINHVNPIQQVVYLGSRREYVTLDGEYLRSFSSDGRRKDVYALPTTSGRGDQLSFTRLIYADGVDRLVGWTPGETKLCVVAADSFQLINESTSDSPLVQLLYNPDSMEIITSSVSGQLATWAFRYVNRYLVQRLASEVLPLGPTRLLTLERTASRRQRLFAAYGCGVRVWVLAEGRCVGGREGLHDREITAMAFFNPLKWLATGAKDGSIKVWDSEFNLKMVFVGHSQPVTGLAIYPVGAALLSVSHDSTLRTWNLEMGDEVDCVELDQPASLDLATVVGEEQFYSAGPNWVELWRTNQLFTDHTNVQSEAKKLVVTDHPAYPIRAVALCPNHGSVHVLSPITGEVLTSAILSPTTAGAGKLVDVAYDIAEESLFCLQKDGTVSRYSSLSNPCKLINVWPPESQEDNGARLPTITHLLIFEHVKDLNRGPSARNKTILLVARADGSLGVISMETGLSTFSVPAHGPHHRVVCMTANVPMNQCITSGEDKTIRVWRIYPFSQEALTPHMSFFCAHIPAQLAVIKSTLFVGFEDCPTANFATVVYNLADRSRLDHSPDEDHLDCFTTATACRRLKLFATASLDGTVRVWDGRNRLVRRLQLNVRPFSLAFCSERGDLLVGHGKQIYLIQHEKFLPKALLRRMIMMVFTKPEVETPLALNEQLLLSWPPEQVKKARLARAAFRYTVYEDILPADEAADIAAQKLAREAAFDRLSKREAEIGMIRDGQLAATRKPKSTKSTRAQALERYLKLFYDRPGIPMPPDLEITEEAEEIVAKSSGKWKPPASPKFQPETVTGFFPTLQSGSKASAKCAGGYIPNSVLVRLLWPMEVAREETKQDMWRPPDMSKLDSARRKLQSVWGSDEDFMDKTMIFDWEDEDKGAQEEEQLPLFELESDREKRRKEQMEREKSVEKSDLLQKMQGILEETPSREPTVADTEEQEEALEDDDSMSKASSVTASVKQRMTPDEIAKFRRPPGSSKKTKTMPEFPVRRTPVTPKSVESAPPAIGGEEAALSASTSAIFITQSEDSTVSSKPSAPVSRPLTPLPHFIIRFRGQTWFDTHFPEPRSQQFPKPITPSSFVELITSMLRLADWRDRSAMLDAILQIYLEDGISKECIHSAKHTLLAILDEPINWLHREERQFIEAAFKFFISMSLRDVDVISESLIWYLDGDDGLRNYILMVLEHAGKQDPRGYFDKELQSWDLMSVRQGPERRGDLRQLTLNWFDKWTSTLKIHIRDTVAKLAKGEAVRAKPRIKTKMADVDTDLEKLGRILTVTFDKVPDPSVAETVNPVDAINYFCEIAHQKAIDKLRKAARGRRRVELGGEGEEEGGSTVARNTVMTLPDLPPTRQCLVRLGESHTDYVKKRRENEIPASCSGLVLIDSTQPAGMQPLRSYQQAVGGGFAPLLHLPMKPCMLNPFPSPLDQVEWDAVYQPTLIVLRCSKKYFLPSLSCPPEPVR